MSYHISRSLIFLPILLQASVCLAETVTLKNGTVLHGSIIQMSELDLTIDTADMGQVIVKRRSVQSINDGVNTPPDANGNGSLREGSSVSPGVAQNVNVNTNVLPQTTVSNPPAAAAPPPVAAVPATPALSAPASPHTAQTMTMTATGPGNAMVGGHLGFGATQISRDKETKTLQSMNWTLIGIRAPSGFFVNINGQAAQSDDYGSLWMAGVGIGFTSEPPVLNDSGSVWEASLIGGHAQMKRTYKNTNSYNYGIGYDYAYGEDYSVESTGSYFGAALGYTYFFNGGFGLHLGISGSAVKVDNQKYSVGYPPYQPGEGDKKLIATSANVGFAYRF